MIEALLHQSYGRQEIVSLEKDSSIYQIPNN